MNTPVSLLAPPFTAVYISSLPLPSFLFLYSNLCPTPFFSVPLMLYTFFVFHSSSTSSYHIRCWCSSLSAGFNRSKAALPPNYWNQSVSPVLHPWSSLLLHTHTSCVCVCVPSSTSPSDLSSLSQLSTSLPQLTLSLAFALTGQSPRAELPPLLFDLPLCPSLLSPPSSLQRLTRSSAVQPSGWVAQKTFTSWLSLLWLLCNAQTKKKEKGMHFQTEGGATGDQNQFLNT